MAKITGNAILLHVDGDVIGCTTEATFEYNAPPYPVTIEEPVVTTQLEFKDLMVPYLPTYPSPLMMIKRALKVLPRKKKKVLKQFARAAGFAV